MSENKFHRRLYNQYVSTHTSHLYGETTINGIERQFPAWKWYYGKFLIKDKSAKILDAGCGNGGFLYFLRSLGYENTAGIDISREQVEVSKRLGSTKMSAWRMNSATSSFALRPCRVTLSPSPNPPARINYGCCRNQRY